MSHDFKDGDIVKWKFRDEEWDTSLEHQTVEYKVSGEAAYAINGSGYIIPNWDDCDYKLVEPARDSLENRVHKFKVGDKVRHTPGYYTFGHKVGEVVSVDPLLLGGLYEGYDKWEVCEVEYPEWELVEPAPDPFKVDDLFKGGGSVTEFKKHYKVTTTYTPYTEDEIPRLGKTSGGKYYLNLDGPSDVKTTLDTTQANLQEMLEVLDDGDDTHGYRIKEEYQDKEDLVNSPSHYGQGTIEAIEYIEDFLTQEEFIGYLRGNIAKYMHRWRYKNGLEDLEKAQWYLNKLIETMETEE